MEPGPSEPPNRSLTPGSVPAWSGGTPALGLETSHFHLKNLFTDAARLDLPIVGRMLLHAALVGVAAGLAGAAFLWGLEALTHLLLVKLAGVMPLRAVGEPAFGESVGRFKPWVLVILPAAGALVGGALSRLAPETRGGGGNATIDAFHRRGGHIRARVIVVKALSSIFTLGSGGAGGREGPTMHIGGAIGSLVGRLLRVDEHERRVLLLAGVAAGISAVFRTPLGAALLAVEVLYNNGFESSALVPAVLSSVLAYSVAYTLLGAETLFGVLPPFPFIPSQLPLYVLLGIACSAVAALFVGAMRNVKRISARLPVPDWVRPAAGGLMLGVMVTPLLMLVGHRIGQPGQQLGLLGGGYGAVQMAISGASWLPNGWSGVNLLLLMCLGKLVAASLTIGTGGSAGDFAPSLAMGGLLGGALGRAAQIILEDPSLNPAAFALVGMGAFYGGIAHAPLAAVILVCELAGNYGLLVPLMLAIGISTVSLRRTTLYEAQVQTPRDSPAHAEPMMMLQRVQVHQRMQQRPHVSFKANASAQELVTRSTENDWQDVFPVLDDQQRMVGLITGDMLRVLASTPGAHVAVVAADLMAPPVWVAPSDNLRRVAELLLVHRMREVPVRDGAGQIVGFVDETEVVRLYRDAAMASAGPLPEAT